MLEHLSYLEMAELVNRQSAIIKEQSQRLQELIPLQSRLALAMHQITSYQAGMQKQDKRIEALKVFIAEKLHEAAYNFDLYQDCGKELNAALAEVEFLRKAIEANHKWHQDYDEYGGYPDSDLCEQNTKALVVKPVPVDSLQPTERY